MEILAPIELFPDLKDSRTANGVVLQRVQGLVRFSEGEELDLRMNEDFGGNLENLDCS
jgi:hypothetical protein